MPHTYVHTDVTTETPRVFECDLECRQCEASAADGTRCKRRVCIWLPFCWQHTRNRIHVKVGPSKAIPGSTGLFATRDFAKGDMVAPYGGERMTETDLRKRYGNPGEFWLAPYTLYSVDSACTRYVASAANGGFGMVPASARNVIFYPTSHRFDVHRPAGTVFEGRTLTRDNMGIKYWMVASRPIRAGEEIVADYGGKHYDAAFARREQRCTSMKVVCDRTRRTRRSRSRRSSK